MRTIEILDGGGAVINTILADEAFAEQYYPGAWRALPDAPAPQVVQDLRISKLAFRKRFTQAEKAAIEFAARDDPAAPLAQRQQAADLRAALADHAAAKFIDLTDVATIAGTQMLESVGLLAAGRADEILTAPVQPVERP